MVCGRPQGFAGADTPAARQNMESAPKDVLQSLSAFRRLQVLAHPKSRGSEAAPTTNRHS